MQFIAVMIFQLISESIFRSYLIRKRDLFHSRFDIWICFPNIWDGSEILKNNKYNNWIATHEYVLLFTYVNFMYIFKNICI